MAEKRDRGQVSEKALDLLCTAPSTWTLLQWNRGRRAMRHVPARSKPNRRSCRKMWRYPQKQFCPSRKGNRDQGRRWNSRREAFPQIHKPMTIFSGFYSLPNFNFPLCFVISVFQFSSVFFLLFDFNELLQLAQDGSLRVF